MGLFMHPGVQAVSDREATGAAARAGLWYKTSNESGALLVPSKTHPRPRLRGRNDPCRIIVPATRKARKRRPGLLGASRRS